MLTEQTGSFLVQYCNFGSGHPYRDVQRLTLMAVAISMRSVFTTITTFASICRNLRRVRSGKYLQLPCQLVYHAHGTFNLSFSPQMDRRDPDILHFQSRDDKRAAF